MDRRINVWLDGKIQKRVLIPKPFGNHTMYLVRHKGKEHVVDIEFPYEIAGRKVYALNLVNLSYPLWKGR